MVIRVKSGNRGNSKLKADFDEQIWNRNIEQLEIRDFPLDVDRLVFDARTVSSNLAKLVDHKLHALYREQLEARHNRSCHHVMLQLVYSCFNDSQKCSYWQVMRCCGLDAIISSCHLKFRIRNNRYEFRRELSLITIFFLLLLNARVASSSLCIQIYDCFS